MTCQINCYPVPVNYTGTSRDLNGPMRACVDCITHGLHDFTQIYGEGDLCPVGKVEAASEVSLAKIKARMDELIDLMEQQGLIKPKRPKRNAKRRHCDQRKKTSPFHGRPLKGYVQHGVKYARNPKREDYGS